MLQVHDEGDHDFRREGFPLSLVWQRKRKGFACIVAGLGKTTSEELCSAGYYWPDFTYFYSLSLSTRLLMPHGICFSYTLCEWDVSVTGEEGLL